jgi:membrane-bound ClpP family serine protease
MCHLILFLPAFGLSLFWVFLFSTALPLYLLVLGISLFLYFKVFQAMRRKVLTGQEAMLGEIWNAATIGKRFLKGEKVRVTRIKGLRVLVEGMSVDSDLK